MTEFLATLLNPDFPFLRYAFITGMLASIAFGIMGTFVIARRISYIAGAISHSVLGGIGVSLYLQYKFNLLWLHPMHGAVAAALLSAIIIGLVSLYGHQREDTVIGAIWAIGMAVGLLFLAKTPGYIDPMSYLFGNILLISKTDVWVVIGLDAVVIGVSVVFYHTFLAVCFDEEYARLRGINVEFYYMLLLCLTALTVVLLVSVVGIVMVIALLTLAPAVAEYFSQRLWQMMILAVFFCMLFNVSGLTISYVYDLPSGPTIIVFAGLCYLVVILLAQTRRFIIHRRAG
ncbi:metal ABC transporter permease [candidate division CSSED10-310 bacterium]|uniref:Metal ABC transporter permease n=1 Tax=candidate division CSSED10-310 bacterium TaxID=2855610 RepID=A0ABV6YZT6_UNCC1